MSKNEGRFIAFALTFYMHQRYGGRSLVLGTIAKKEGVVEIVEGVRYFGKPSLLSEAAGPFGIFQSWHGPSQA